MEIKNITTFPANQKTFISLKNQAEIPYYNEFERLLMPQLEYDTAVDSYEPFEYKTVSVQTSKEHEVCLGFILQKNGHKEAVIANDRLAKYQKPVPGDPKPMLPSQSGAAPIPLTILLTSDVTSSILTDNTSFLYSFAIQPSPSYEECHLVKDFFAFVEESPIKRLKAFLQCEAVIYYLLFNYGLRADIINEAITDEMVVRLGPLMGGILKKLQIDEGDAF